ncbi:MAG TPA: hypothetical protein PLN69_11370, partial [bacterium]|nr:hypothetical protein [bacterium]
MSKNILLGATYKAPFFVRAVILSFQPNPKGSTPGRPGPLDSRSPSRMTTKYISGKEILRCAQDDSRHRLAAQAAL